VQKVNCMVIRKDSKPIPSSERTPVKDAKEGVRYVHNLEDKA